jgi:Ca2+-binding RTX toxin-like protein
MELFLYLLSSLQFQQRHILYSGAGGALMNGGEGSDRFWIADQILPRAASTVSDFQVGIDVLALTGLPGVTGISSLSIRQQGADTSVNALGRELAIIVGVQASDLTSSSFLFVSEPLV